MPHLRYRWSIERPAPRAYTIQETTGVPRSTAYVILAEAGVGPSRLPAVARRAGDGAAGFAFVMERLLETTAELTAARAMIEQVEQQNAVLRKKLAAARLGHRPEK